MRTLSLDQSVALIPDGASLMVGGFMAVGTPERVIDELIRQTGPGVSVAQVMAATEAELIVGDTIPKMQI